MWFWTHGGILPGRYWHPNGNVGKFLDISWDLILSLFWYTWRFRGNLGQTERDSLPPIVFFFNGSFNQFYIIRYAFTKNKISNCIIITLKFSHCFSISSFNQLDLPAYETYDKLRKMLLLAISECSEGFGLA